MSKFKCFQTISQLPKSLIGFLHADWQIQMYYIALAPLVYIFIFYWLLPTSAAWLYSRGDFTGARKVLVKLSKRFPRSNIDDQFIGEVEKSVQMKMEDSVGQTFTQADLFKTPNMRLVTIVEMYQWFATTLGFKNQSTLDMKNLTLKLARCVCDSIGRKSFNFYTSYQNQEFRRTFFD